MTLDEEILKNKGDRTKFQNDATFAKFQSGNQSDFFTSLMKAINYYY
jgi:hypothetical protein